MLSFIKRHDLLNPNQLRFRSNLSCVEIVKELKKEIRIVMENKKSGHLCLLDLKKAFDKIDNHKLLNKIELIEVPINLIENYLIDRKQNKVGDNSISAQKLIAYGVTQGSNLVPFCSFCTSFIWLVPQRIGKLFFMPIILVFFALENNLKSLERKSRR